MGILLVDGTGDEFERLPYGCTDGVLHATDHCPIASKPMQMA